ncbi:hypothetical protein O181_063889 [Austropuccinia psidii MF-1]|uniref:Uncharacterized protein n=1 Tax=Austropuccinia psidii MF-1 TaxID=1389203 RepID=A0A9Q3EN04_9BASI|nr:hypothetical protein [Austropuccinia psidii MF-1]
MGAIGVPQDQNDTPGPKFAGASGGPRDPKKWPWANFHPYGLGPLRGLRDHQENDLPQSLRGDPGLMIEAQEGLGAHIEDLQGAINRVMAPHP